MSSLPIVLHISEAFGGGIVSAIDSYVRSTSDAFEHYGCFRLRDAHKTSIEHKIPFRETTLSNGTLYGFYTACKQAIEHSKPDIVHLHSTIAGLIGRLLPLHGSALVYSPHCYAFERSDISAPLRIGISAFETIAASRLDAVGAIGDHEAELASHLRYSPPVITLRNAVMQLNAAYEPIRGPASAVTVGMLGRADEQKGVDFFLATARKCIDRGIHFKWIGGANLRWEAALAQAGVEVTGWVKRDKALSHLAGLDIYFHTAAWEGTPISLLEAAYLNLPIVARNIPHLNGLPIATRVASSYEAAETLVQLNSPLERSRVAAASAAIIELHSVPKQRASLIECYRAAIEHRASRHQANVLRPAKYRASLN